MSTRTECLQVHLLIQNNEKLCCWVNSNDLNIYRSDLLSSPFTLEIVVRFGFYSGLTFTLDLLYKVLD